MAGGYRAVESVGDVHDRFRQGRPARRRQNGDRDRVGIRHDLQLDRKSFAAYRKRGPGHDHHRAHARSEQRLAENRVKFKRSGAGGLDGGKSQGRARKFAAGDSGMGVDDDLVAGRPATASIYAIAPSNIHPVPADISFRPTNGMAAAAGQIARGTSVRAAENVNGRPSSSNQNSSKAALRYSETIGQDRQPLHLLPEDGGICRSTYRRMPAPNTSN